MQETYVETREEPARYEMGAKEKIRKPQTFRSYGKGAQKSFGISILEDI